VRIIHGVLKLIFGLRLEQTRTSQSEIKISNYTSISKFQCYNIYFANERLGAPQGG
jgi:hypothetical protein